MALDTSTPLLAGRIGVVTGAAAGIGRAVALALARFGADVALCDRDGDNLAIVAKEIDGTGRRSLSAVLDVRDGDAVGEFCDRVGGEFGRVDVLVNNAGGGFHAAFMDVNEKGQDALVRENFTSVTRFIRGVVPLMSASGGSIINITSIEAHRAAPGYAIYAAMKAAVDNLTKSLALELGSKNIRVNCVAPDVIPTPGVGDLGDPRTPLPVRGHPDDVAGAVVFLASDLSRFVTGTTLHVDGGNFAAGGWRRDGESFSP
ncbi:MAG: SDR family NAD(P)-dependent oxidoreductase [Actinomycetota bacterium]|nr:SDR family oxidoreductase [Actinomycetota bacterium]